MTDTPSTREAANRAASAWNLGGEPSLIGRLENFTYRAGPSDRERIVRVTEPTHRSFAELEAELDWLGFLSQRGIKVSAPLPSDRGNLIEPFETADGPLHVSVFVKAPGSPFNFQRDWGPEFHRALGELIGSMHAATMGYSPPEGARRKSWAEDMGHLRQVISTSEPSARSEFDEVVRWATTLDTSRATFGLVHTDLHYANMYVDTQYEITAFDFDGCHYDWFAYDLAVPLFYALLSFDLPSMDASQQDWFYGPLLDGYKKKMPIANEWIARIPGFVRFRRADLFTFICKELDIDNLTHDWDVRAVRRIREGFNNQEPLV